MSPADTLTARERLLAAALHRFAADGVLGTTLDAVRAEAGVSVGAIYHHFPDKQALAAAVYTHALAAYQRSFLAVLDEHDESARRRSPRSWPHAALVRAHAGRRDRCSCRAGRPAATSGRAQPRAFFARVMRWWRPHVHHGALRDLPVAVISAVWLGPALELVRHGHTPTRRDVAVLSAAAVAALTIEKEPAA